MVNSGRRGGRGTNPCYAHAHTPVRADYGDSSDPLNDLEMKLLGYGSHCAAHNNLLKFARSLI